MEGKEPRKSQPGERAPASSGTSASGSPQEKFHRNKGPRTGKRDAGSRAPREQSHPGACPVFRKCGGCQLQNMDYPRQLAWKQDRCQKLLGSFGPVAPILGMENPLHYRNKVQAAFGYDRRAGKIISGIYQSSTHHIVSVDSCMTEDEKADEIIVSVRNLMKSFKFSAYDEMTGRGFLRHVLVKRGFLTNEIMVVFVTGGPVFPAKNNFVRALRQLHPEITTIVQNVNDKVTSMVLGEQEKVLFGPGFIEDVLCGCRFRISARSFYQINPVQTQVLYEKALEYACLTGTEKVLDAYCGIGTIGIVAAKQAGTVLGVELNRDAVKDAIANAKRNEVKNIRFYTCDAGEFMGEMAQEKEPCDVVLMDPPRAGASQQFLDALTTLAPQRIVYISCNPETLARDLTILTRRHYKVTSLQPVDMFPFTNHCEVCVELCRK